MGVNSGFMGILVDFMFFRGFNGIFMDVKVLYLTSSGNSWEVFKQQRTIGLFVGNIRG